MQRFLDHRICVAVTKNELRNFLQNCEDAGLVWANGQSALDFADDVVFLGEKVTVGRERGCNYDMVYSRRGDSMGKEIVDYLDLVPLDHEESVHTDFLDLSNLYG